MKYYSFLHSKKATTGFTLIELLLYLSISSILLLVTSLFLSTLLESRVKNQTIAEVEQQGIQVMQLITQSVRNAKVINSPTQGNVANVLSINTIFIGANPTIFESYLGGIRVKEGPSLITPLTNSRVTVSSLSFSNLSRAGTPGIIRIQFTLTANNPTGRNEYSFSKVFIGSASLR